MLVYQRVTRIDSGDYMRLWHATNWMSETKPRWSIHYFQNFQTHPYVYLIFHIQTGKQWISIIFWGRLVVPSLISAPWLVSINWSSWLADWLSWEDWNRKPPIFHGKIWENMAKYGKTHGTYRKIWENMGTSMEHLVDCLSFSEIYGISDKVWCWKCIWIIWVICLWVKPWYPRYLGYNRYPKMTGNCGCLFPKYGNHRFWHPHMSFAAQFRDWILHDIPYIIQYIHGSNNRGNIIVPKRQDGW